MPLVDKIDVFSPITMLHHFKAWVLIVYDFKAKVLTLLLTPHKWKKSH